MCERSSKMIKITIKFVFLSCWRKSVAPFYVRFRVRIQLQVNQMIYKKPVATLKLFNRLCLVVSSSVRYIFAIINCTILWKRCFMSFIPWSNSATHYLSFWLYQLNGPLPAVLQNPINPAVRATGCDAISNIGAKVFEHLPVNILGWNDLALIRNFIWGVNEAWASISFVEIFTPELHPKQQIFLIEKNYFFWRLRNEFCALPCCLVWRPTKIITWGLQRSEHSVPMCCTRASETQVWFIMCSKPSKKRKLLLNDD